MEKYLHPNGFSYSQFEVEEAALKKGISVENYIQQ